MRRALIASAVLLAAILLPAGARQARALDPDSADALNRTLQALQEESSRTGPTPSVAAGSPLDRAFARSPELRTELYDVAGDVFREVTEAGDGNVDAMSRVVERGRSDPAAFEQSLSPATRARIEALSRRIEDAGR